MKLTKAQRAAIHDKFGGRCAYCGEDLPEKWHVDHLVPIVRNWGKFSKERPCEKPENDNLANMMPACPACNISKHSYTLEFWREMIAGHIKSLNLYHPIYRLAKSYGLVVETGNEVEFFFEKNGGKENG